MEKPILSTATVDDRRSRSPLPVNGSIRLPNGQSFRYVRSDIMREAIDAVTRRGQIKQP
ncbi:MAG: hypothetical protein JO290_08160 [Sphingomonadaceae bacterium]|nr:hypothetical protein [Sphingomonadaceae bacterium]